MAKKIDPALVDILTKYGERAEDALWDCHGVWVAFHKAIERVAAKAGVVFDLPQIVEASSASKTATILVSGRMGDRVEWSFGEASPSNNKNAYPFAMAEKRAKDRVVLKLVGLHGHVYSEEESDDFKPDTKPASSSSLKKEGSWETLKEELEQDLLDCHSTVSLARIRADYREKALDKKWPKAWLEALKNEFDKFEDSLELKQHAAE